jgi:predicted ATPase
LRGQRIVITGGPGFGKTSIIEELETRNYTCFHEVSRKIIKEQLENGGDILPWKDLAAFSNILFESRIQQFNQIITNNFAFFDRGIPDIIAYMLKDDLMIPNTFLSKTKECKYYSTVFIVPPWEEIYRNDGQRMEDFKTAAQLHEIISSTYTKLGYEIVVLPKVSVKERADFILNILVENCN